MTSSASCTGSTGPAIVRVGFYEIERTIGKGNFAVVKLARHRITKTQVAIKIIDKKRLDEENLEKVYREVQILKLLEHPNIIKLYQVMETSNMVYIVSEYAENGEVFEYIAKKGRLSEDEAHTKFTQILDAVDYCHQNFVVHRDLKAENLLLDSDMNIKIADFGFGNFFKPTQDLSTWCGSPPYAAPEVFEGQQYVGPRIDVWSLGVILYVLVCGSLPFDGHDFPTLRDRVLSGRFRIPYFMSTDCENLIKKILVLDPKRRYTIPQIRRHRWVTSRMTFLVNPLQSPRQPPKRRCERDLDECALRLMQNLGMDLHKITEAIKTDAFNHYTAIYYLLLEKLLKHRTTYINMANQGAISPTRNVALVASGTAKEAPPRRPSSIADQAVTPRPVLAETKQGPFSHTTDCVQVPLINLMDVKESDESRQTEILPNSQKKVSVDEGVDMECGSSCSRDDSQDLPFIPGRRKRYGSSRDALRDSSQNSSASFQSIGTGMSESPQASFDLEVDAASGSLQHDASAGQVFADLPRAHPMSEAKLRTLEPTTRVLHPSTLPRLPFTRTSLAPGSIASPAVTMTPPFGTKFYHPNNSSSGSNVSGLVESGNGGSGCQVGGLDVRDARSPVNFREGRRASDEFLASAVKNNAVPFRQRLRETSKAWAVVTESCCSSSNEAERFSSGGDEANRNKDLESADQAMADFPSEERAQVLHRRNIWQTQLHNYLFKPSLLVPAAMVAVNPEAISPALQFRFQHLQIDHSKPLDHRIIPHPVEYSIPQRTAMVPTQLESFEAGNLSRVKRRRFVRQASYRLSQGSEGESSSSSWLPSSEPLSPTFEVMEDEEEDDDDEKTKEETQPEEREECDMEC